MGSAAARLLPAGAGFASTTAASLTGGATSTGSGAGGAGALAADEEPNRAGIASSPNAQAAVRIAAEVNAATAIAGATTDWRRRPA
ncbi:MAG: hypothetical protein E6J86_18340 [Deltaproteobacteria bacterium]|nr:MAG: hypothetical protein E6J86_18340 [Deltaproteobacteria bacterium]